MNKSSSSACGKYIVAKKNNKFYKVFLKDLKCIKMRTKKTLPPVPAFNEAPFDNKSQLSVEMETEDSCQSLEEEMIEIEAN